MLPKPHYPNWAKIQDRDKGVKWTRPIFIHTRNIFSYYFPNKIVSPWSYQPNYMGNKLHLLPRHVRWRVYFTQDENEEVWYTLEENKATSDPNSQD